ncbi:MAG TPA: hypothetical protein VMZ92_17620 [Planctomycetota bacterium]|nr:hypothetical protein [Planctomycetota bacterium]
MQGVTKQQKKHASRKDAKPAKETTKKPGSRKDAKRAKETKKKPGSRKAAKSAKNSTARGVEATTGPHAKTQSRKEQHCSWGKSSNDNGLPPATCHLPRLFSLQSLGGLHILVRRPRPNRETGFFVAFYYSCDALEEVRRFFKKERGVIIPLTVKEILEEAIAKKLA